MTIQESGKAVVHLPERVHKILGSRYDLPIRSGNTTLEPQTLMNDDDDYDDVEHVFCTGLEKCLTGTAHTRSKKESVSSERLIDDRRKYYISVQR